MTKNMTEGKPLPLIISFAIPLFLGSLLQQTYNMIDAVIVGRTLGASALAGVGASSSVLFLIFGFCNGTASGFGIPLAQAFGMNDWNKLRNYIYHACIAAGMIALIFALGCSVFCRQILHIMSTPDDIFRDAYLYLLVIFIGIPFTILYNLMATILRAVGDSRTPFIFLAISTVLNIFLDLFCIVVLRLGVAGAAIATVMAQALSGVLCLRYIVRKVPILHIGSEDMHFSGAVLKLLLVMGVPMGLQFSITAIGSMIMQSANNSLGSVCVSTYTVALKIKQLAMCPYEGIGTAISVYCGQNYGAGNYERIRKGLIQTVELSVCYGLAAGILLFIFGRNFAGVFIGYSESVILDQAKHYLHFTGASFWLLGFLNVLRPATQGIGFSGRALFCGVFEMFARGTVGLFLVPIMGFNAICFADQSAWVAAVLYIIPMCMICMKKVKRSIISQSR